MIEKIFSASIGLYNLEINNNQILNNLKKLETNPHSLIYNGYSSLKTGDETLLELEEFLELKKLIADCCINYCDKMKISKVSITNSWFNKLGRGGEVLKHNHPHSIVSGAYYPFYEENHSPLTLLNPDNFEEYREISDHITIVPKTNLLVVFPSYLNHFVTPTKTKERYTISFNTTALKVKEIEERGLNLKWRTLRR